MTKVLPIGNAIRRAFLGSAGVLGLAATPRWARSATNRQALRMGLTPAFVHDEHGLMDRWREYLEVTLGRPVEFVQRDSYRETMDLLRLDKLDFAWICDYPYVYLKDLVRLLAVPLNQGRPYYRSYLIVAADDAQRRSMRDLKGTVFAYSDPYSNTGYLVPRYEVRQLGENPDTFFKKTIFTWSHRKAIAAVSTGFAQGAAVDSFVWDTLAKRRPAMPRGTRIVSQSREFGFPPMVAHSKVSRADFLAMQSTLLGMKNDAAGSTLLRQLNIDGFVEGEQRMYDDVAKMVRAFGDY